MTPSWVVKLIHLGVGMPPRGTFRLDQWAHVNITKFNKVQRKVLHLSQGHTWRRESSGDTSLCLFKI